MIQSSILKNGFTDPMPNLDTIKIFGVQQKTQTVSVNGANFQNFSYDPVNQVKRNILYQIPTRCKMLSLTSFFRCWICLNWTCPWNKPSSSSGPTNRLIVCLQILLLFMNTKSLDKRWFYSEDCFSTATAFDASSDAISLFWNPHCSRISSVCWPTWGGGIELILEDFQLNSW